MGLEDTEILKVLQSEGFLITARTLWCVQMELGLIQCTDDPSQKQVQEKLALQGLIEEAEAGTIEGYGKELLYCHMQQAGYTAPRFYLSTHGFPLYRHSY